MFSEISHQISSESFFHEGRRIHETCLCLCSEVGEFASILSSNISKHELERILAKKIAAITKDIKIRTNETNLFSRRKNCARDDRVSSTLMGYLGAMIVGSILLLCVVSDFCALIYKCFIKWLLGFHRKVISPVWQQDTN